MRLSGMALLILGFLWIAWDAADGFVSYQHARCIWQTQHLPAGDMVQRRDAADATRELSLALKDRHRKVMLPASLMLAGGFMAAFGKRTRKNGKIAASPDS
jgi:hypothetical protein